MTPTVTNNIKAGQLFKPVAGVLPSGILTTDAYSGPEQTFTNLNTILWDSNQFNVQGQRWEAVDNADSSLGCRNAATSRTSSGTHYNHVTEFEFLYTGLALDIAFIGSTSYDTQVYVEWGSRMYKAQVAPLSGTVSGLMHRRLVFGAGYHGRIRVHLGGGTLVGIKTEQSAIVKPSPDRIFSICDGDRWADGTGFKQASGVSYFTAGLCDYLFERTGIVWGRRAQADTGFFYNSSSTVSDDTPAANNSTRWFSADRKSWMINDFADKPLFYLILGSLIDGGRSGATGVDTGPMAVRALSCYQWIRSQDPYCAIVHVSPQPFTGAGAAGTLTGPPTAWSGHDVNRQEQQSAINNISRADYINSFGPTSPWWTGTGSNGTPTTSQQGSLLGPDGVNPNAHGFNFYAGKIATELSQILVYAPRGRRQV